MAVSDEAPGHRRGQVQGLAEELHDRLWPGGQADRHQLEGNHGIVRREDTATLELCHDGFPAIVEGRTMGDWLRLRVGRRFLPLPATVWRRLIRRLARRIRAADQSLTDEHRAVQHFAVREIPRSGKPLAPEAIAAGTAIPVSDVVRILERLERKRRFLWRDPQGWVLWAYPVTADETPHHMAFSTGERLDAA